MAIFSFPVSPTLGQTYLAPNSVLYTWDGEKWVGSGAGGTSAGDWLDKTPLPGDEQTITPGQVTDRALGLVALPGQAGNLFEIIDASTGLPLTVFDEEGNLGIGTASPVYPAEIYGGLLFTGPLLAQGTAGLPGQHLVTDGIKAYWANETRWDLNSVLAAGNVSTLPMTVGGLTVRGDLNVTGTQTIVNTEVIKLADNIITLNSNYTGNTPNENAGLEVNRGSLAAKYFFWDETLDKWSIGTETFRAGLFEGNLIGNVTGQVSSLANHNTNSLPEGSNNLYFTNARARNALTVTGDLQYNRTTGVLHYETPVRSVNNMTGHVVLTTDEIPEGKVNKYGFSANTAWAWFQTVKLQDMGDVDNTPAANSDILYYDGASQTWKLRPGDFEDNFVTSGTFDANTGDITHVRNDGNTISVNLDGRYLQLDTGGIIGGPVFGTDAIFDYINAKDGLSANNSAFGGTFQVNGPATFDNTTTFNGVTKVLLAPVAPNDVANKLYIDQVVANSEIFTSNATFNTTTGVLTQTRNDSSTYSVNLDGRYVVLPTAPTANQTLTFNGSTWIASNPVYVLDDLIDVSATGAANGDILYYDSASSSWKTIAGDFADNFLSSAAFNILDGVITLTRNDGNNVTVDIDGRYLELTAGGSVAGNTVFNGGLQSTTIPIANNDVTNKYYVDQLVANSEVKISSFTLNSATGNLAIVETNSNTYSVNLFTSLDSRYVNVTGDTITGPLVATANVEVQGTLIANTTTLKLDNLADVNLTLPVANSDLLAFNAAANTWVNIPSTSIGLIIVSPTAPVAPVVGTAWYDSDAAITTSGRTFVWDGTQWIDIAPAGVAGEAWAIGTGGTITLSSAVNVPTLPTYKEFSINLEDIVMQNTAAPATGIEIYGNATDGTTVLIDSISATPAEYPINTTFRFTAYVNGAGVAPTTYLAGKYKKTLSSIDIKPKLAGDNLVSGTFTVWVK